MGSILEAWEKRDRDAFEKLIKSGKADLNYSYPNQNYFTILEIVAQTVSPESQDFAELLVATGAPVNQINLTTGKSPIHLAAECLNYPVLEVFCAAKADINQKDLRNCNTVLHILARKQPPQKYQPHKQCLDLVLNWPDLYLDHENKEKKTPLLTAYQEGAWRTFKTLLHANAYVDFNSKVNGDKTIYEDLQDKFPDLAMELLAFKNFSYSGASELKDLAKHLDQNAEDRFCYEFDVYMGDEKHRVAQDATKGCIKLLNIAIIRHLLKASQLLINFITQDALVTDKESNILDEAQRKCCRMACPEILKMILNKQPCTKSVLHCLAYEYPFTENHEKCLKIVIEKIDINIEENGETALHRAAQINNEKFVKIMLENGANIFKIDKFGKFAYEYIPDDLLKNFFDLKIEGSFDSNIFYFDHNFLNPKSKKDEIEPSEAVDFKRTHQPEMGRIVQFANSKKGHFLTHPIFQTFIAEKWHACLPIFYSIVLLATVFDGLVVFYASESFHRHNTWQIRIVLYVFLPIYIITCIMFAPRFEALKRGKSWLSYILIICTLAIVIYDYPPYWNWFRLVSPLTGIIAGIHWFSKIGPHPLLASFGVPYVIAQQIFLTVLKTLFPYVLIVSIILGVLIAQIRIHTDVQYFFFFFFLATFSCHLIAVTMINVKKILKNQTYHKLQTQATVLADYEEKFISLPRDRYKFLKIPGLNRILKSILFFYKHDERLRLDVKKGNVLEAIVETKKSKWRSRHVTMDDECVEQCKEICQKRRQETETRPDNNKSELSILVEKANLLMNRIRLNSAMLEKLEDKGRDMENLLIQSMRVNSLRDDEN